MPSNFSTVVVNDSDSDEESGFKLRKDEYGEPFEDYGFLKRAEEYKAAGNEAFKKDRYQSALEKYNEALDQLITVAHDKSIVLGQKKWNDVVVLRSMIHLNMSTCHFKMKEWENSANKALECLVGNIREESMMIDPHVRMKLKAAERKQGTSGLHDLMLEQRLPRPTRAKAWFRLSQCYANLEYIDRAKDSLAKALEVCDDDKVLAEISQHSLRLEVLEKQQKDRQKKQFAGFFDKLQERGGYTDEASREKSQSESGNVETAASSSQRARFEELDNDED